MELYGRVKYRNILCCCIGTSFTRTTGFLLVSCCYCCCCSADGKSGPFLAVSYAGFAPLLVEGLKELDSIVSSHQREAEARLQVSHTRSFATAKFTALCTEACLGSCGRALQVLIPRFTRLDACNVLALCQVYVVLLCMSM